MNCDDCGIPEGQRQYIACGSCIHFFEDGQEVDPSTDLVDGEVTVARMFRAGRVEYEK